MEALKPLEHRFKRLVVSASHYMLKRGKSDFASLDGNKLNRVLFIRPEKLGDTVISFPVIDALKRSFPHLKISLLTSPTSLPIVKNDPRFQNLFLFRKSLIHDIKQIATMRRERFDCVIDLICDDSVTALYLSQLCAPGKPRIGVGKRKYAKFYDFNYDYRDNDAGHVIDNTLKLLKAFAVDPDSVSGFAPPYLDDDSRRFADNLFDSFKSDNRYIKTFGYNLSAGKSNRIWPLPKVEELLKRLLQDDSNAHLLLFCMGKQRQDALMLRESLNNNIDERVHIVPEGMNIIQASALISKLDLLITPDTSLVHIARSFQVPVVGLYPQFMRNFVLWCPYKQEAGAVVSGANEIYDISVDKVFDSYRQLMQVQRKDPVR